jgi:dTDP-4-amino-4,6-dideoxygalactose transaminase
MQFFHPAPMAQEQLKHTAEVLKSGDVGPGEKCRLLQRLLEQGGCHVALAGSGTAAIRATLGALIVKRVIVPALGPLGVGMAAVVGRDPSSVAFADVLQDGRIDVDPLSGSLGQREPGDYVAVLYVHHWRYQDATEKISGLRRDGFAVIEDMSRLHPDLWFTPLEADARILSFSAPKWVTGGQGGAVIFKDAWLAETVRLRINSGRAGSDLAYMSGDNNRMSDLNAAYLLDQFEKKAPQNTLATTPVDDALERRCVQWQAGGKRFFGSADFPKMHQPPDNQHPPLHNVTFWEHRKQRDHARHLFERRDITARVNADYLPAMRAFADCSRPWDRGMAQWWADCSLYLPFGPGLSHEDFDKMVRVLEMVRKEVA